MKNFKKVISAVIALAITVSSFATVSASKFTDVADTAAYAEAVEILTALGIVSGYAEEDGSYTFRPEGTITRAEAATMIVGALNMSADAKASSTTSQFADVNEQAAWAAGYINVGVNQGFISGMGDGTFAPQDQVTYAQMCVMLTSIAGYGDYASQNGGWPKGYTDMAASTGISAGVAAANDTAMTRGQVAQMIWNTLQVPMLGVAEYSIVGNTYAQLDGSEKAGDVFKTLLSSKYDAYVVQATIDETATSNNALEAENAKLTIQKAEWWGEADRKVTGVAPYAAISGILVELDGLNVNEYLLQMGKAIIAEDELGDFHLVYFVPTGKTETKQFAAEDYVKQAKLEDGNQFDTAAGKNKVRYGSRYYELENQFDIYVNGALHVQNHTIVADGNSTTTPLSSTQTLLDKHLGGAVGTVTFINNDTDSAYEAVMVDNYNVAMVASVEYENSETIITITNKEFVNADFETIRIADEDVEDGKTIVKVIKDGEEAELSDLAKNDVIAYKADFAQNTTAAALRNPKEIEILATTDTISGKVTGSDTLEGLYTIDGTDYELVTGVSAPTTGETYTAQLDPFGRIYKHVQDGSADKYGIALEITTNDQLKILLADGSTKTYEFADTYTIAGGFPDGTDAGSTTDDFDDVEEYLDGGATAITRVVKYTVKTSTQEVTRVELVSGDTTYASGTKDEYKARNNMLGSAKILDTTAIIDATRTIGSGASATDKAASYSAYSAEALKDGADYNFAVWKTGTFTNLVIITAIGTKFNEDSRFAVVQKTMNKELNADEDLVEVVTVLYNGKAGQKLTFKDGLWATSGLAVGDAFYFEVDGEGIVKDVFEIYNAATPAFTNLATVIGNKSYTVSDYMDVADWDYTLLNTSNKDIQLVEGYLVSGDNGLVFAEKESPLDVIDTTITHTSTTDNGVEVFSVADDAHLYLFNSKADVLSPADKYSSKADAAALPSTGLAKYEIDGVYTATNISGVTDMAADAAYAIAMIVDETVVEVYAIR